MTKTRAVRKTKIACLTTLVFALLSVTAHAEIRHTSDLKSGLIDVNSYLASGQVGEATIAHERLGDLLKVGTDAALVAQYWQAAGDISAARGRHFEALDQYTKALGSFSGQDQSPEKFNLLNRIGVTHLMIGDADSAISSYSEASQILNEAISALDRFRLEISLARAYLVSKKTDQVRTSLETLGNVLAKKETLPPPDLLSAGEVFETAQLKLHLPTNFRLRAFEAYQDALNLAAKQNDLRSVAFANGYLGRLYLAESKYQEALHYTRQAILLSQNTAVESKYRWEWQLARIQMQQKQPIPATATYGRAIAELQKVRATMLLGSLDAFSKNIAPLYNEYLDALLTQAKQQNDSAARNEILREAIDSLEQFKVAEIEDYFKSECIELDATKDKSVLDSSTALIYPVVLNDRLEILVKTKGSFELYTQAINGQEFNKTLYRFRAAIEKYDSQREYLADAAQLYDTIVKPLIPAFETMNITNLVFLPDGPLRIVPMAALYDGKNFLIEKYTVATTPSANLTDMAPRQKSDFQVLVGGVTEGVQGYQPLPSVRKELQNISALYKSVMLKDSSFNIERAQAEMADGPYSVVHFATHGEFNSDYRKSYLLAYDNKLTMARLEKTINKRRYTDKPLDLLVLSACQTATGDDRAALGLAGVAIKAGAKSAIATLWFINDAAASQLISEFYVQLKDSSRNKAQALRNAQMKLIQDERYRHPSYWAPFLLIGNWT